MFVRISSECRPFGGAELIKCFCRPFDNFGTNRQKPRYADQLPGLLLYYSLSSSSSSSGRIDKTFASLHALWSWSLFISFAFCS